MKRIAKFEKVSFEQFQSGFDGDFSLEEIKEMYEQLNLPKRATVGSAGYDFFAPFDITLSPGQTVKIPTGIRAKMEDGWVLKLYPRSGLGFKFRLQLNNTVDIIASPFSRLCFFIRELYPPIVSFSSPLIEPLLTNIKTISVKLFFI